MDTSTYLLLLAAHLLGVIFWVGGLIAVYWLLRLHTHAPPDALDKLSLLERSLALMMDIAAAVAIGAGLVMAIGGQPGTTESWFARPDGRWLHYKLLFVLALIAVHGMVRARVAKFGRGTIVPVPQWQWSLLLVSVTAAVLLASTKLATFQ